MRVFQLPGLIIIPLVFFYPAVSDLSYLKAGAFVAGFLNGGAVQLLELFAPRVSRPPARDG